MRRFIKHTEISPGFIWVFFLNYSIGKLINYKIGFHIYRTKIKKITKL